MTINQLVISSIRAQAESIIRMSQEDNNPYEVVIDLIRSSSGKLIFTGMGKSGIIAKKLAATYSSTGVPSFYVHPGEAYHGDLGMIEEDDILFAFSNSGETVELINMLKYSRSKTIIGVSKSNDSTLARYSKIHLECKVIRRLSFEFAYNKHYCSHNNRGRHLCGNEIPNSAKVTAKFH